MKYSYGALKLLTSVVWLQMARLEMAYNLKMLGKLFDNYLSLLALKKMILMAMFVFFLQIKGHVL